MEQLIIIAGLVLVLVGSILIEIKARKDNRQWLILKEKTVKRLTEYTSTPEHEKYAQWLVDRFCEVCDVIAAGGILDSKANLPYAQYSTKILEELKRIGFFER